MRGTNEILAPRISSMQARGAGGGYCQPPTREPGEKGVLVGLSRRSRRAVRLRWQAVAAVELARQRIGRGHLMAVISGVLAAMNFAYPNEAWSQSSLYRWRERFLLAGMRGLVDGRATRRLDCRPVRRSGGRR